MKVLALAFPGFTFIDLAGPMQAFMMLPGFSSQIVWHSKGIVDSDAGVSVQATEDFGSCWKDPDILFVPGNSIHLFKQLQDDRTIDFIADVGSRAKWITSVCNGSLLLGAAGLLKGYKAASYWYTREHLSLFGAIPTDARYVIDRNRGTGGGMTAGIDFGLAMVGQLAGEPVGRVAELAFEYAPQPFRNRSTGAGRPRDIGQDDRNREADNAGSGAGGCESPPLDYGKALGTGPALASDAVTRRWSWFR